VPAGLGEAAPEHLGRGLADTVTARALLCGQPRSVAEISAEPAIPFDVAKMLVGDLVTGGRASSEGAGQLEVAISERIRDLGRAL
jgi:hypothetical protein